MNGDGKIRYTSSPNEILILFSNHLENMIEFNVYQNYLHAQSIPKTNQFVLNFRQPKNNNFHPVNVWQWHNIIDVYSHPQGCIIR